MHRDIKPENILLTRAARWSRTSASRRALGRGRRRTRLTADRALARHAAYMSPEQAAGERTLDGRSDLYSLGCVLYEMLAGEPPFTGPTPQAIIAKRFTEPAPSLAGRIGRDVPAALDQALRRALARDAGGPLPTRAAASRARAERASPGHDGGHVPAAPRRSRVCRARSRSCRSPT